MMRCGLWFANFDRKFNFKFELSAEFPLWWIAMLLLMLLLLRPLAAYIIRQGYCNSIPSQIDLPAY